MVNQAPDGDETSAERRAHVRALLEKMSDVMFLSYAACGDAPELNGRPLHVTRLADDDSLWFMVGAGSTQVAETRAHDGAVVTWQDGGRWLRLNGRATVIVHRAEVRALWSTAHEIWFPNGPDDPDVCLIRFAPEGAEYWDASGARGLTFLFESARALLTGTAARPHKGQHGEVGRTP